MIEIYGLDIGHCVCKNNFFKIHETRKHILSKIFCNFCFFPWRRVRIFTLAWMLFCFGIIVVEQAFISCKNPVQGTCTASVNLKKKILDNFSLSSKFSLVKSHRAQTQLIFKSWDKMSCNIVFNFSVTSRTVSHWSASITCRTLIARWSLFHYPLHSPLRLIFFCATWILRNGSNIFVLLL